MYTPLARCGCCCSRHSPPRESRLVLVLVLVLVLIMLMLVLVLVLMLTIWEGI